MKYKLNFVDKYLYIHLFPHLFSYLFTCFEPNSPLQMHLDSTKVPVFILTFFRKVLMKGLIHASFILLIYETFYSLRKKNLAADCQSDKNIFALICLQKCNNMLLTSA